MKQTFSESKTNLIFANLENPKPEVRNPKSREPIHVFYGGANLFKADTPQKLSRIARANFAEYAPDTQSFAQIFDLKSEIAEIVFERVGEKLAREAIEDLRIDFEDGYGFRSNAEEDGDALAASAELAKAHAEKSITAFCGFRIKSFQPETVRRAVRTLDLFLTNLLEKTSGELPANFVVTLPKVENEAQVSALCQLLADFEIQRNLPEKSIKIEILIETPEAILNRRGEINLRRLVEAADSRCAAAHFGAYDFTSAFGIAAEFQDLKHALCDFARNWMQIALAPLGARLSDSVTTLMPVAIYKGENLTAAEISANRQSVVNAWRAHFANVTRSLSNGFYQSWDLHPAQLVARYAAVYAFFLNNLDSSAQRLRSFLDKAARASLTGNQFDDAASANGLLNFFIRAHNCGAIGEAEILAQTGLTVAKLHLPFAEIAAKKFV
jgi:citrate lyase beta subunit